MRNCLVGILPHRAPSFSVILTWLQNSSLCNTGCSGCSPSCTTTIQNGPSPWSVSRAPMMSFLLTLTNYRHTYKSIYICTYSTRSHSMLTYMHAYTHICHILYLLTCIPTHTYANENMYICRHTYIGIQFEYNTTVFWKKCTYMHTYMHMSYNIIIIYCII